MLLLPLFEQTLRVCGSPPEIDQLGQLRPIRVKESKLSLHYQSNLVQQAELPEHEHVHIVRDLTVNHTARGRLIASGVGAEDPDLHMPVPLRIAMPQIAWD